MFGLLHAVLFHTHYLLSFTNCSLIASIQSFVKLLLQRIRGVCISVFANWSIGFHSLVLNWECILSCCRILFTQGCSVCSVVLENIFFVFMYF